MEEEEQHDQVGGHVDHLDHLDAQHPHHQLTTEVPVKAPIKYSCVILAASGGMSGRVINIYKQYTLTLHYSP